jgi:hypothetical protein
MAFIYSKNGTSDIAANSSATTGNLGIGTSNPLYALHVSGDNARIVNKGVSNTAYNTFSVNNSDGDGLEVISYGRSATGTYLGLNRAGSSFVGCSPNGSMGFGTRNSKSLVLGTADQERIRITAAGNVGIGTTDPQTALDVNGGIATNNGLICNNLTIQDWCWGTLSCDGEYRYLTLDTQCADGLKLRNSCCNTEMIVGNQEVLINGGSIVVDQNLESTSSINGLVLRSPDNNRWRVKVSNTGVLEVALA